MIKPDKSKQDSKKIQIKDMFNDISSRYDQINKIMTLNMDKNWVNMARYGLKLSQDAATDHMNLLETYLALYRPPGTKK